MTTDRPTAPPFGWADRFFTFGITGTNGKTSTTHLLQAIVRASGASCLLIGTLGYYLDERRLDELPRSLAGFHDAFRLAHQGGGQWAAVECTSRGLADGYAKRWRFDLGVFTNLSPDHLQTHGSWEHYLASKAQLFVHLGPGRTAVLNAGDVHALMIDQAIPADVLRRWFHAPGRGPALHAVDPAADLAATGVELDVDGTRMMLAPGALAERLGGALQVRMVGEVFAENALAAALAGEAAGLPDAAIVRGLAACAPVPGRFEVLHRDPIVVVDYAHSPDALVRTCATARTLARGRVIVVFGAGGESTPDKRGPMGEAVGSAADLAIVTNDNPRNEDPRQIAAAVGEGVTRAGRAELRTVLDRAAAIEHALGEARSGDVVVIAGKGHERGQTERGAVTPFSDVDEARRILGCARPQP
jgi:UDP-N-acetylmuramoyl-L-alanyl-D-glutamate--2,6-diaminopimelate ligase